jgi:small subunit ribosomal protein S21
LGGGGSIPGAHENVDRPFSSGSFLGVRQSFDAGWIVVEVVIGENDRLDVVLKQFQRKVIRAGVHKDLRKKRYYEKPSEARQRKAGAARLRLARARRRAV